MALTIKNQDVQRLVRELARRTGETVTEAIRKSVEDRLHRLKAKRLARSFVEDVHDILGRVDALPNLDSRTEGEILGYDEHGLPS